MFRSALPAAALCLAITAANADPQPPLGATEVSAALQAIQRRCPADLPSAATPAIHGMNNYARGAGATQLSDDQATHLSPVDAFNALLAQNPQLDEHGLARAAVDAMASALGPGPPNGYYIDYSPARGCGCEVGIGLEIQIDNNQLTVVRPLTNGPAHDAGISPDDKILAIDGVSTTGWTLDQAIQAFHGPLQSTISLTIARDGSPNPLQFQLQRAAVTYDDVEWRRDGDIGVISVYTLTQTSSAKVRAAIRELRRQPSVRGYILDLRRSPGGLLDQAIEVADLFLDGGVVNSVVSADHCPPEQAQTYNARRGDDTAGAPLVVLVDHVTASGAELVAAALVDRGRAVSVGQHTFGLGEVRTLFPLSRRAGLKLPTAQLLSPSGHRISDGITPTYTTPPNTDGQDFALERAVEILRAH